MDLLSKNPRNVMTYLKEDRTCRITFIKENSEFTIHGKIKRLDYYGNTVGISFEKDCASDGSNIKYIKIRWNCYKWFDQYEGCSDDYYCWETINKSNHDMSITRIVEFNVWND